MAKLVSLGRGLSHGSIAPFESTMGRCRGRRPLHMAAIGGPRGCRFAAKIAITSLEMAKLVSLSSWLSHGWIARFEPNMGHCMGTHPLHMAVIGDPSGCRFVTKVAKTSLEIAKIGIIEQGARSWVDRFFRAHYGALYENAPPTHGRHRRPQWMSICRENRENKSRNGYG